MKAKFPTICIDDFFEDPDAIRNYGLSLEYINKGKNYPGKRSLDINVINPDLAINIHQKFLSMFYEEKSVWEIIEKKLIKTNIYFQKINSINYAKIDSGWTHTDDPCISSGVIYLNKNYSIDSGTTIKDIKKTTTSAHFAENFSIRNKLYSGITPENWEEKHLSHENNFDDSIIFKNKYNRMIMFGSSLWHRQSGFYMNGEERLTMVFFINDFFKITPKDRKNKFLDPGYEKQIIYY